MLASYVHEGTQGVGGYAKTIANPIMARTDFAALYQQLPQAERNYFKAQSDQGHRTWLDLVLRTAWRIGGPLPTGNGSVFSGNLYNDVMYGPNPLMARPADPRYQTNPLPNLTRRQWLEGIAFENVDRLTARNYPRATRAQKEELESLGSYGNKVDLFGANQRRAPIFEFRGIPGNLPYTEWYAFAMSFFRYIREVNRGSVADYAQTLTPARQADLAGMNGVPARDAERTNQGLLALTPAMAW
jgi:hypothetical protein